MRGIVTVVGKLSPQGTARNQHKNAKTTSNFKQTIQSETRLPGEQVLLGDKFQK